jgi:hypothetical protein
MIDTRRLLTESIPIASILLFWMVLSWIGGEPTVARGFQITGIVMAVMYIVVRGTTLGRLEAGHESTTDLRSLLLTNVRVALPVGLWFFGAMAVGVLESLWSRLDLVGVSTSPADELMFVFTATGVGIAVLFAVVAVFPPVSSGGGTASRDGSSNVLGDD